MRHKKKGNKLSRSRAQRKALLKSLLRSIIISEKIKTTTPKAKVVKPQIDKIIGLAKKNNLSARRQAFKIIGDHSLVKKLFNQIGPRFNDGQGGYSRIYNLGFRKSDGASLSQIELTKLASKKVAKETTKKTKSKTTKEEATGKKETSKEKGLSGLKKMFKKGKKS
ncbi:MAG: 50S ribosomal protein L17 [Candidatus Omnitrophica bacterium]|nr:50S ribosomal protein L17 [Candidatus Omnitrophota bacterium]MCF7893518.1 50S ribosomal protein L17 [Candidatus Omnitrophota bacterium]